MYTRWITKACKITAVFVFFTLILGAWFNNDITQKHAKMRCEKVLRVSKSYQNERPCHSIAASALLRDFGKPEVGGRIMTDSEVPRDLISFIEHPRDLTSIPPQCQKFKDQIKWKVVFFVKSSATNYKRRKAIRNTWGNITVYRSALIKVVFIVGTIKSQTALSEEIKTYKDILQIDKEESSSIVPEKVIAGMQWASEHLSSEWVYASLDDDIVVLLPNLVVYMEDLFKPNSNTSTTSMPPCYEDLPIVCVYSYQPGDVPARDPQVKWYISRGDYPDNRWPVYCRGGLYLMSNKLASDIFMVSRTTPRLHLDDVWITGLMRRKLKFGDCNVIAAPYSRLKDGQLHSTKPAGKNYLVKHLWGNIEGRPVNVVAALKKEWTIWKAKFSFDDYC